MDFSLTEEQKILRDNIVRFAREVLNQGVAERDREQTFSRELWRKCGEIGLQGLPVPEEYGGQRCRPADLRDRRSRRSATAATTAAWSSRSARTCSPASCRSGSTATRSRSGATCPACATAR